MLRFSCDKKKKSFLLAFSLVVLPGYRHRVPTLVSALAGCLACGWLSFVACCVCTALWCSSCGNHGSWLVFRLCPLSADFVCCLSLLRLCRMDRLCIGVGGPSCGGGVVVLPWSNPPLLWTCLSWLWPGSCVRVGWPSFFPLYCLRGFGRGVTRRRPGFILGGFSGMLRQEFAACGLLVGPPLALPCVMPLAYTALSLPPLQKSVGSLASGSLCYGSLFWPDPLGGNVSLCCSTGWIGPPFSPQVVCPVGESVVLFCLFCCCHCIGPIPGFGVTPWAVCLSTVGFRLGRLPRISLHLGRWWRRCLWGCCGGWWMYCSGNVADSLLILVPLIGWHGVSFCCLYTSHFRVAHLFCRVPVLSFSVSLTPRLLDSWACRASMPGGSGFCLALV